MLLLPVVFLCNAFLFLAILNGRFRTLTTLIVSGGAYVLSLIANLILSPALNDGAGHIGNMINVFLLLVAAVFLYTNNIVQKILVALVLICNFELALALTESLLGVLPFGLSGFVPILIGIAIHLFVSFLTLITFVRPLHYFAERRVSVLALGLCLAQALGILAANGTLTGALGVTTFAPRFFLTVVFYLLIAFAVRGAYNAAKYKERCSTSAYREALFAAEADSFNAMVGNVTDAKNARDHHNFMLGEIADCAKRGDCESIRTIIADEAMPKDPLLDFYSDNPYINAVVASKAAYAQTCGVTLQSNVELGATRLKTIEFCVILNDALAHALRCAEKSQSDERLVRVTALPVDNRVTFEVVYPAPPAAKKRPMLKRSTTEILETLFEEKHSERLELDSIRAIIERYSGTMNLSAAGGSEILRVVINS